MEKIEYLGIDVAGTKNTWFCSLIESDHELSLSFVPKLETLSKIIHYVKNKNILAATIDAQLTWSCYDPDNENSDIDKGFRISDLKIQKEIGSDFKFNLASQNSLMAVPVRGRQLAEYLRVRIPVILETHPTVNLIKSNIVDKKLIHLYKKDDKREEYNLVNHTIFSALCDEFDIKNNLEIKEYTDGLNDSLICSIISYLVIKNPIKLRNLTMEFDIEMPDIRGYAPFYILKNN